MLSAKIICFDDPYYMQENFQVYKNTLEYSTSYPPLGYWGSIETAIVDELKNSLAYSVNGSYSNKTVQRYLYKAADKVNKALDQEF